MLNAKVSKYGGSPECVLIKHQRELMEFIKRVAKFIIILLPLGGLYYRKKYQREIQRHKNTVDRKNGALRRYASNHISPDSTTVDVEILKDFFQKFRPVRTNHELVRIGSQFDGGYLLPDDLEGIKICFSPGVSTISDFEVDMANRGVTCYLADYSVDAPSVMHKNMHFEKKFLGDHNDDVYMTLESWVEKHGQSDGDLLLQMDIEQAEYDVINCTSEQTLSRFRIITMEVHHLENLCKKEGFDRINNMFQKLSKYFEVVHIHPNNFDCVFHYLSFAIPGTLEYTFLRKDRITHKDTDVIIPHPLDTPNSTVMNDYSLPENWYS
jgi:hypothetical protein